MKPVIDSGRPISAVAKGLGINEGTLGSWVATWRRARRRDAEEEPLSMSEWARLRELLRPHADAGDRTATYRLANLQAHADQLADAGNRDERRAHADAGDGQAADRLAELLAEAGADRLRRFGFDVHSRIADGPTW